MVHTVVLLSILLTEGMSAVLLLCCMLNIYIIHKTITFLVSNYIQEASVTEAVENITVLCSVVQAEPLLICHAVFYCTDNESTTLNLSSSVVQNFTTTQLCNVTIQVVSSNDVSQVLEQTLFYNVLPSVVSVQPTSPSVQPTSPSSTSNSEY